MVASLYASQQVPIPFSKKTRVVRQATADGVEKKRSTRVTLKPGMAWHRRNFLAEVLIPSLFTKRSGERAVPRFPKIRPGEFCVTWIGHASFLIQTHDRNILVDPNWAKWLKVIKVGGLKAI